MYKITFNFPNLPKGGEIDILGLNEIFENGRSYTITKEEADMFRELNKHPVVNEKNPLAPVEWDNGPTLLEAFKDNDHVTVEVIKAPAPPKEGDK